MSDLDDMIRSIRALGELASVTAKRAAPLVEEALRASASAQQSPDGKAWAPKKDGKGVPYANAASHIHAKAIGPVVRVTLDGPEVFGHFGRANRVPRPMLPDPGSMPEPIGAALRKAADQAFAQAVA